MRLSNLPQTCNTVVQEIRNLKVNIADIYNSLAPIVLVFEKCGSLATNGLIYELLFDTLVSRRLNMQHVSIQLKC